jgi:F0F1-type ATP synthase membrane subunit c/vacuolar-type H+-ATPase subunit K
MAELLEQHLVRLRVICGAMLSSVAVYGLIVALLPLPAAPPFAQGEHFLWIFAALSVVNLVTLMPVYRAMLAGPRRVHAVSRQPGPLLAAHQMAHVVAFTRLEAVALLGLVLFFLTHHVDWFWAFAAVAVAGMVVLWPTRRKVQALIGSIESAGPATTPA